MPDIRQAFEHRRGEVERGRAVEGGVFIVEGVIALTGTGEATVDVNFPVRFIEKPVLVGGGGAADNQRIVVGEYPRWNVGVLRWHRVIDEEFPDQPTYKGCTLLIIVEGATQDATTFLSEAYWSARGKALNNPIVAGL
jgi:hypothetical protein